MPGLARAYLMKSGTLLMPSSCARLVFITITLGTPATRVMGAKSFCGSKGSLLYSALLMPWVPTVPMSRV